MKKFPKIKYPNDPETDGVLADEVVVTEKLDGANFRLTVDSDHSVWIGTRNHAYDLEDDNFPKAFHHARDWVQENVVEDGRVLATLADAGTLYGEAMHLHSLEYQDVDYEVPSSGSPHFGEGYPSVVFFDWYQGTGLGLDDPHEEAYSQWAHWDSFESMTSELGLPITRVIERGDPQDMALEIPEESMFGGPPEGIVVRRVDGSVRAKKVSDDFKEQNATAFNDPNKAQSDAAEFVAMFITDMRVEKQIHKLVDEGEFESPQMEMMGGGLLPERVLRDVMEEEGWNLLNDEYGFEAEFDEDFKDSVRSKTSKRCARVLRTLCQEF